MLKSDWKFSKYLLGSLERMRTGGLVLVKSCQITQPYFNQVGRLCPPHKIVPTIFEIPVALPTIKWKGGRNSVVTPICIRIMKGKANQSDFRSELWSEFLKHFTSTYIFFVYYRAVPSGMGRSGFFGRPVNPISTGGSHYTHLIITCPPEFSDLATALHSCYS